MSADTTFFTGGHSKDAYDVNQWNYGGHGAPDKNELDNAYAAAMFDNSVSPAHLNVYFGADRFDNSGNATMGFWFFQNPISINANGTFTQR